MKPALAALAVALLVVTVRAVPPEPGRSASTHLPSRLSETGLYEPGTLRVDRRNRPYSPQYPLWTDGAGKSRWIRVPPGGRIDVSDADNWVFPVGTTFWKQFDFAGRRVETRMLRRAGSGSWTYASYVWNEAQTDATLAPATGVPGVVDVAPGRSHDIPAHDDCRTCHENGSTPVLGFTALQLSDDRDSGAPHAEPLHAGMVTLRTLLGERWLTPADPVLEGPPPRIPGDPDTRAALGYLTANCGHCHNEQSPVATVRFPLRMPAFATRREVDARVADLRARLTAWDLHGRAAGTSSMVTPGAPDLSVLFVRMRSRRPSSQMPPLGTVVADREGLELISRWISSMAGGRPS